MLSAILLAASLSPFDQVVASERAFAAASLEKGLHEAFLLNLAPDAIAFVPLPGPARKAHEGQPPTTAKLSWGPAWVAVSSAGDLAVSTGPWGVKHNEQSPISISTGIFFSVWRKQPDGTFKVAVDAGIASPLSFAIPKSVENGSTGAPARSPLPNDAANARIGVTTAERALGAKAVQGLGKAIEAQADPAIRVYREGKLPGIGHPGAGALLAKDERRVTCAPDKIVTAASGDLGYAYGTCTAQTTESAERYGFLRVWRLQPDGTWKILADVTP